MALLLGTLLATTAFTVLTAASRTAQLRTVGTVSAHFVPAYDILVRPKGSRTSLETQSDTVQPNFLSGIYGGITGITGSLAGAALGLAATARFTGQLPAALDVIAGVAVAAGVVLTAAFALVPARFLRRLPAAHLLAEE